MLDSLPALNRRSDSGLDHVRSLTLVALGRVALVLLDPQELHWNDYRAARPHDASSGTWKSPGSGCGRCRIRGNNRRRGLLASLLAALPRPEVLGKKELLALQIPATRRARSGDSSGRIEFGRNRDRCFVVPALSFISDLQPCRVGHERGMW